MAGTDHVGVGDGTVALIPWEQLNAEEILEFVLRCRDHLRPWEPERPPSHYSLAGQEEALARYRSARESGLEFIFGIRAHDAGLAGRVALTGVARGPFLNANLGYCVAPETCSRGVATGAVKLVTRHAFEVLGLHRVQAAVMPRNGPSLRVLDKAGFRREGHALRYLKIAGEWEDHDLFALLADEALVAEGERCGRS